MRLKPDEFWSLTPFEIMDMIEAVVFEEQRQDDMLNQRVAWQTAHIMNSSGNYKKTIKPEDLYVPLDSRIKKEKPQEQKIIKRFDSKEQKEEYLNNLMQKFGKSGK